MKSTFTLAVLAALAAALGCATDPNKQVTKANSEYVADVSETKGEEASLEANQEKDHAVLDSEHEKEDAKLQAQKVEDASKFTEKRDVAQANVVEARRTFRAEATARLDKVDAKAAMLEGKRSTKKGVGSSLTNLRSRFAAAKTSVANLDTVPDASWFDSKKSVESALTSLEKDVNDIEGQL